MGRQAALFLVAGVCAAAVVVWLVRGRASSPAAPSSQKLVQASLTAPVPEQREQAAIELMRMGPEAVPQMREVLHRSESPKVKAAMIQGLAVERDFDSMDLFLDALDDPSLLVRGRAGGAVQRLEQIDAFYRAEDPPEKRKKAIATFRSQWEIMKKTPSLRHFREKLGQIKPGGA